MPVSVISSEAAFAHFYTFGTDLNFSFLFLTFEFSFFLYEEKSVPFVFYVEACWQMLRMYVFVVRKIGTRH